MQSTVADLLSLSPPGWGTPMLWALFSSLQIAIGAFSLGLSLGIFGASAKIYGGPVLQDILKLYTTIVRAVPELVLILILYYGGTISLNAGLEALGYPAIDINGLVAGIIVLGFVQGAYATEIIRGAILAIPHGEIEAARSFGMTSNTIFRKITAPAMLPNALPGLSNLWLMATKDTALLAVVGFQELTLQTRQAAGSTKAYFTFFIVAGALYLAITVISSALFSLAEKRARRGMPMKGR
ncbi:ABC transporter permease [Phyllobacterium sp. UNC302MFCol5.2]|uniref:ABC transporter permease n=1 Tax=Phyllobacterium sp. UNC302MFCol5.2 TaxID=1449065 RepID=UPI000485881D|nr:ABC transporter permease [Phyllobacterium sp. UNC302MFCol5.2]